MMDVVTPSITKDHPSRVRRSGLNATSQIHFYKYKNLQCAAARSSLSSSSCGNLRKTVSPSLSLSLVHSAAPSQPLLTLMTFI